jgi:hypothetical protein
MLIWKFTNAKSWGWQRNVNLPRKKPLTSLKTLSLKIDVLKVKKCTNGDKVRYMSLRDTSMQQEFFVTKYFFCQKFAKK